jgi:hypothetical protein
MDKINKTPCMCINIKTNDIQRLYKFMYIYTYSYVSVLLIKKISSRHGHSSRKQQRHQCAFDALMHMGVDFSIKYIGMIDVIL